MAGVDGVVTGERVALGDGDGGGSLAVGVEVATWAAGLDLRRKNDIGGS